MGMVAAQSQEALIASALRWWRDAGIDTLVDEAPRQWLGASRPAVRASVNVEAVGEVPHDPNPVFSTRGALIEWLMTASDVPEGGSTRRRVGPSGSLASGLMVLVDFPELADSDAGHLLSGEIAPLFERMLAAIGADRAGVYVASIAPARPPGGRLVGKTLEALAPLARRHIEFVAPARLWIMGAAASRAVLGMSDLEAHGKLHSVKLNGVIIDAVVTAHPRFLTDQDKKRRAWKEMQRLIAKDQS